MDTQEKSKKINELKQERSRIKEKYKGMDLWEKRKKKVDRINRHIEFLKYSDIYVEEYGSNGFIINDKFIVGALKNRWRVKGRGRWYWFKDIPDFVENYVREG